MNAVSRDEQPIFRCPACHQPLPSSSKAPAPTQCASCGREIGFADGIPLLVNDPIQIQAQIEEARLTGRDAWYSDQQVRQLEGPYRHHIRKRRAYVETVIRDFAAEQEKPVTGLDLGCGDGVNLVWLAPLFDRTLASDYNLLRLKRVRQRLGNIATLFLADATDYPVLDDRLDLVFFNHVLEHIPEDRKALGEVRRILRPGGMLILGVPNEGAAFWRLAYKLQPHIRNTTDHVHFYTADSIAHRAREAGFNVEVIHPIGWGIPHWSLDAALRRFRWFDDLMERIGRNIMPSQATSLYLILRK